MMQEDNSPTKFSYLSGFEPKHSPIKKAKGRLYSKNQGRSMHKE